MKLKLVRPGSTGQIAGQTLQVKISSVNIEGAECKISYLCVWWKDGERKTAWVSSDELEYSDDVVDVDWEN